MTDQQRTRASKSKPVYVGGCLCGAIRFEAIGPADKPHTCSCRMCQRHSGALTTAWVEFAKDRVRWTGAGGAPALWRSSDASSRAFCPACGSTLGAVDDAPVVALMVGVFDTPKALTLMPTRHSHKAGRPRWWHVECRAD
ncbi:GFA family protein [Chthonobacter rhizosphaerae]|uniref:GFA family protein n=1 Tax=Chthonobacter rhizosphaerae TaxID=2735553 RepID=UPI0015EF1DB6|nr:GFA family protein [Chthonobacter rhizosphaerae]